MVWLAAGGSTAVIGYLLYRYLSLPASPAVEEHSTFENNRHNERPCEDTSTFAFEERVKEPLPASSKQQEEIASQLSSGTLINIHEPDQIQERSPKARLTARRMTPPPAHSSSPPRLNPPSFSSMLAPPRPGSSALRPSPSVAASLRVPSTKVLSNTSMAPTSSTLPQTGKPSRKVVLQPGHSPLDWAILTKNPNNKLRGNDVPAQLIHVTPSQLKYHNGRKGRDAWSVYEGKVYNISPYLPFHPGGEGELMRGAGKDAGQLFMEVHPWVNWHNMLSECMVGILVGEGEEKDGKSGGLDEMD